MYTLVATSPQSTLFFLLFFFFLHFINPLREILVAQPQEQRYPVLTVGAVFSYFQTKVVLPMLGTVMYSQMSVNTGECTRGLYGHRKRVCTESWHRDKDPLPHWGIKPASSSCRSDGLPTELHPRHVFELWFLSRLAVSWLCTPFSFRPKKKIRERAFYCFRHSWNSGKKKKKRSDKQQLVSWCFEPSQPLWITSGLNTDFTHLQVIHFTSHYTTSHVVVFSLFIFGGHSTREPASGRVTYFILRAYTGTIC